MSRSVLASCSAVLIMHAVFQVSSISLRLPEPKSQLFTLSLAVYVFRNKFKPTMISLIKLIKMIISGSIKLGAGQMISVRMRLRAIFVTMMRKIGNNG